MSSVLEAAIALAILHLLLTFTAVSGVSWEEWWTYDGISGPAFWGLINPEWSLCNKGRRQSPVNLEPDKLLYDPNLRFLHIDKHRINGLISNTGHSVIFTVENETRHHINITGGPLSYKYQFHEIHIHYGLHDQFGSEHAINGYSFPAEIQIFGFNSQLYSNFSEALHKAQGVVSISLLLQLGDLSNPELRILTEELENIKYGGAEMPVNKLSVRGLLPDTDYYMTYDGSTTAPACFETVTWIIINKPIYITKQQLHALRRLMQGDARHPKAPLGNNFRPPQPLHHRAVRTNIDFDLSKSKESPFRPLLKTAFDGISSTNTESVSVTTGTWTASNCLLHNVQIETGGQICPELSLYQLRGTDIMQFFALTPVKLAQVCIETCIIKPKAGHNTEDETVPSVGIRIFIFRIDENVHIL